MPGAGDPVCLHSLQGGFDFPVRLFPGQVGMYDAVVVVDGGVPDGPPNPPVVAFLGPGRPSERHQELGAVLLDGQGLIHTLECVVGVRGLFEVAGEERYGGLHVRGAHHLVRGVDVAAGDGERDGRDATV
jgi:hypothetical protein